ncbi:MAG: ComEA family DNA-binding protein [Oscillospiraceae bacterium]|nr:ComEA family DNA-binding protein [Oscillospiraceae bacterium]
MRLRKLELIIIGLTLAFACFIGGYFAGRTSGTVSISPSVLHQGDIVPFVPVLTPAPAQPGPAPSVQEPEAENVGQPHAALPPTEQAVTVPPVVVGDGRININTASRSELMDLPGIGSSLSERIIDYRNRHGFFRSIEELRNISGIGERRFEAIMDRITVGS